MNWLKDLRIAARVLLRTPGFTAVAVITVGLAIGANAAIFTVVNSVILRPLPYSEPDALYTFALDASRGSSPELPLSPASYFHFRDKARGFADMGGYATQQAPLSGNGQEPVQIEAAIATASMFRTLRASALLGRTFTEEEDVPGGPQLVVLSHDLWRSRFGEDRSILGSTVEINGTPREVVGVMPPDFAFPSADIDLWVPLRLDPATQNYGGHFIAPVVRVRDGVTQAAVLSEVQELIGRLSEVGYTQQWFTGVFTGGAVVRSLRDDVIGDSERPLLIVFGALAIVFLIACSNIANLFVVRERARTRESAVRLALGATRRQLVGYTLAESTLIAVAAGTLGVLLAVAGSRLLLALQPAAIPRLEEVGVDLTVLGFTALVTLAASLILGLLPALRAAVVQVAEALREGGRSATAGRRSQALRAFLVTGQVALAVILLVGAGLMVRSAAALRSVDPGFAPDRILTFSISLPVAGYPPGDQTAAVFHELTDAVRAMPGVEAAGAIDALPLVGQGAYLATGVEGMSLGPDEFPPTFHVRRVTPGYFEAMGIPLVEGRTFEPTDHQARLGTAVVGAAVGEQLWPDASALDRRIAPSTPAFSRIVGVVGDVRITALDEPFDPVIYMPMVDSVGGAVNQMTFVVRSSGDPLQLLPAIRAEIARRDPNLPITRVRRLDDAVAESMAGITFTTMLLGIAAGIALLLGAVGIYGLISFIVGQRTSEIGIRMSLGAAPGTVMGQFLRQALVLTATGVAIGLVVSTVATRLLQSLLFGVGAFDPFSYLGAPLVFLAVATLACLIPARRAARVDPAAAMRVT
jgi:putative ABC transport system permease protein